MILPLILVVIAVACLIGLVRVDSLPTQAVLAFWAVAATIGAAQTSTDESVAARKKIWRETGQRSKLDSNG